MHTRFGSFNKNKGERVQQFLTRLRNAAKDCKYGNNTDNHIRDEFSTKCKSTYLRRKLLEEGEISTLVRTLEIAGQCERV